MRNRLARTVLNSLMIAAPMGTLVHTGCEAQQVKPSQSASVMQMIADTRINVQYDRPVARDRTLFGGIVPWGDTWTPGANRATIIEFSTPVQFGGQSVPAGKYSIWAVPTDTAWTVILSKTWDAHHHRYAGATRDQVRVGAKPEKADHMEVLGIHFPVVASDSAIMRIHWGTTSVPVAIRLPSPD